MFKGTERRTAQQLALELEVRGGWPRRVHRAATTPAIRPTCSTSDLPLAVDILTDLVRRPLLRESDLELERNVVLEEINGVADTPDDLVFELHADGTLARSSLRLFDPGNTGDARRRSRPTTSGRCTGTATIRGNCVIAAAGNLEHDQLLDGARAGGLVRGSQPAKRRRSRCRRRRRRAGGRTSIATPRRLTSSSAPTLFRSATPAAFALALLTNVFGGGMSSRLFQRVREELGLAYAMYAYKTFYRSSGQLGVYVGTQPATADGRSKPSGTSMPRLAREGLPPAELTDGKQQLKGQIMLSLESPGSRMARLAGFELYDDAYRPLDEMLARDRCDRRPRTWRRWPREFFAPERQTVVRLVPKEQSEPGPADC